MGPSGVGLCGAGGWCAGATDGGCSGTRAKEGYNARPGKGTTAHTVVSAPLRSTPQRVDKVATMAKPRPRVSVGPGSWTAGEVAAPPSVTAISTPYSPT